VSVAGSTDSRLPIEDDAAAAVVLVAPPGDRAAALVEDACRVASSLVIAVADLTTFDGRLASELAPGGWRGSEAPGVGTAAISLARFGDRGPRAALTLYETLSRREDWLRLFSGARFGPSDNRLFVFERLDGGSARDTVTLPPGVEPIRPEPRRLKPTLLRRLRQRVARRREARRLSD
jgi:hypothetical protein